MFHLLLVCAQPQEAYEVLVNALERGAELGECVRVIETELSKRELPGDVRRANREVIASFSLHRPIPAYAPEKRD